MSAPDGVFVIVDIGCIECGESTDVIGVYETEDAARAAFSQYADDVRGDAAADSDYFAYFGGGGQHTVELFRGVALR